MVSMTITAPARTAHDREAYRKLAAREQTERDLARFGALDRAAVRLAATMERIRVRGWIAEAQDGFRNNQRGYTVSRPGPGRATLTFDDGRDPVHVVAPIPFA